MPAGKLIEAKIKNLKWAYFILKSKIYSTFWSKLLIGIEILYEIRACCLEKSLKINKRAGTFIPYSRVIGLWSRPIDRQFSPEVKSLGIVH